MSRRCAWSSPRRSSCARRPRRRAMRPRSVALAALVVACAGALVVAARSTPRDDTFVVHRLVSDVRGRAAHVDPQLVNPWGLAATPTGEWWTGNEARESSTLYSGTGRKTVLERARRRRADGRRVQQRSRIHRKRRRAKRSRAVRVRVRRRRAPRVDADGTRPAGRRAPCRCSRAAQQRCTAASRCSALRLYVTDFHNARVVVLDSHWRQVRLAFSDPAIPEWYAPFGIAAIGGHLFVTYAWRAPVNGNDAPTGGYVDEFTADGRLVARLPRTHLNEPWASRAHRRASAASAATCSSATSATARSARIAARTDAGCSTAPCGTATQTDRDQRALVARVRERRPRRLVTHVVLHRRPAHVGRRNRAVGARAARRDRTCLRAALHWATTPP